MVVPLILMFFLLFPVAASAEIYKYVDEDGVVMLTDVPRGGNTVLYEKSGTKSAPSRSSNLHEIIVKKADKYSLDPSLISAVIKTESAFDSQAISRKGAMGLMQLMPGTARDMGVDNPFDPDENIEGGARYLKHLVDKYNGDLTRALAAYNAGPHRVETSSQLPNETRDYIRKVYSHYTGERRLTTQPKLKTVIYRVVLEDGSILYTNNVPKDAF